MLERFLASSVIKCTGRFETYREGSLENPKITLGSVVQPVDAIVQQFSDKTTRVICPYFDDQEDFCKALDSASDTEESRRLISDRACFAVNSSIGNPESDDEKWNSRVLISQDNSTRVSTTKCPYKITHES